MPEKKQTKKKTKNFPRRLVEKRDGAVPHTRAGADWSGRNRSFGLHATARVASGLVFLFLPP